MKITYSTYTLSFTTFQHECLDWIFQKKLFKVLFFKTQLKNKLLWAKLSLPLLHLLSLPFFPKSAKLEKQAKLSPTSSQIFSYKRIKKVLKIRLSSSFENPGYFISRKDPLVILEKSCNTIFHGENLQSLLKFICDYYSRIWGSGHILYIFAFAYEMTIYKQAFFLPK